MVEQRERLEFREPRVGARPDDELGALVAQALEDFRELGVEAGGEADPAEVGVVHADVLLPRKGRRRHVELVPVGIDFVVDGYDLARPIDQHR